MKRYWVFAGSQYYPPKGMVGFKGSYDVLWEAKAALDVCKINYHDWGHIFDAEECEILEAYDQVTDDIAEILPKAIELVWQYPLSSPEWDSELFEARKLLDDEGKIE